MQVVQSVSSAGAGWAAIAMVPLRESSLCWSARTPCCCPTIKRRQCHVRGRKSSKDLEGVISRGVPERQYFAANFVFARLQSAVDGAPFDSARRCRTGQWRGAHLASPSRPGSTGAFLQQHHPLSLCTGHFCSPSQLYLCRASELIGARQSNLQAPATPRVSELQGSGPESACQRSASRSWRQKRQPNPARWVLFSQPF